MKKIVTIYLFLILVISITNAQEIPNKASEIIAKTAITGNKAYEMLSKYLFDNEIRASVRDSANLYLVTEGIKPVPKMLASYRIIFTCRDDRIKATIETRLGHDLNFGMLSAKDEWRPARYEGMGKKAFNKIAFQQVTEILRTFTNHITYK